MNLCYIKLVSKVYFHNKLRGKLFWLGLLRVHSCAYCTNRKTVSKYSHKIHLTFTLDKNHKETKYNKTQQQKKKEMTGSRAQNRSHTAKQYIPIARTFKKKHGIHFFGSPTQCPIRCSGWKMKMALFLQAAPGVSLGEEFDALYKRLELSSAVKVKTHQFFSKFHHVLDSSVCVCERKRERNREGL